MTDDAELLRRYAELRSEADFTAFVERHLHVVYHAALRRTGGRTDLAQDVAQSVFSALARDAARLSRHEALTGWLYTATRHTAHQVLRAERRRQRREREADLIMMNHTPSPESDPQWHEVREQLDGVMDELPARDREAILLRFFHGRPFAQIGAAFGLSEDAARKRVERALEQLRARLVQRGITSTSVALGTMLSAQAGIAAPAGLAQSVAGTALAQAAGAVPAAGLLQFMGIKTTVSVASLAWLAGILSLPTISIAVYETRAARRTEIATAAAQREQAAQLGRLKALQQQAGTSEARVVEIQRILDQAQAALTDSLRASAEAGAPKPRDPRTDGARFLASFPQARTLLIDASKVRTAPALVEIFRRAGLSPAQIDDLDARIWGNRADNLTLAPSGMGWSVTGFPPDDEMRQILGEAGFREFQDYTRMADAYGVATQISAVVAYTAPALNATQVEQLAHAIVKVEPGPHLTPGTPEWDATMAPLRSLMTAEQWQVTEGAFAQVLFPRLLAWTERNAGSARGENPNPKP